MELEGKYEEKGEALKEDVGEKEQGEDEEEELRDGWEEGHEGDEGSPMGKFISFKELF